jgi:hypothetical protein
MHCVLWAARCLNLLAYLPLCLGATFEDYGTFCTNSLLIALQLDALRSMSILPGLGFLQLGWMDHVLLCCTLLHAAALCRNLLFSVFEFCCPSLYEFERSPTHPPTLLGASSSLIATPY